MTSQHEHEECVLEQRPLVVTALSVGSSSLVEIALSAGDVVRAHRGTLWYTINGRNEDVVLSAGQRCTAERDATIIVSGLGRARFSVTHRDRGHHPAHHPDVRAYSARHRLAGWLARAGVRLLGLVRGVWAAPGLRAAS